MLVRKTRRRQPRNACPRACSPTHPLFPCPLRCLLLWRFPLTRRRVPVCAQSAMLGRLQSLQFTGMGGPMGVYENYDT